ncbi:chemotaxis protein [Azospirillum sp.]|uniref:chemotaxis protein n=1 Tax=Azospirillum sp. TaxID=34012 RepID=UPI003D760E43
MPLSGSRPPHKPMTQRALRARHESVQGAANRYHDQRLGAEVINIVVGGCVVSDDPEVIITTTLGSCVAACVFDPVACIGGMNHFLLPDSGTDRLSVSSRYGSAAMEQLINRMLSVTGRRDRLRAKVFGGASVNAMKSGIGQRNVEFVMDYLATEGIPTMSWDVGGGAARAVRFYPASGRTQRRLIGDDQARDVLRSEASFMEHLRSSEIDGGVELF